MAGRILDIGVRERGLCVLVNGNTMIMPLGR
jgi:hypothetical protein